jgi:hypothetical protein
MPIDDTIESDNSEDSLPSSTFCSIKPNMKSGLNSNGTNAPKIGESENEKDEKFAQNAAELIDKHFLSKEGITCVLFILILAIMGYIFIQDNQADKLNDWKSIWWSIQKCSFFVLLFVVFVLYQTISGHLKNKRNNKTSVLIRRF